MNERTYKNLSFIKINKSHGVKWRRVSEKGSRCWFKADPFANTLFWWLKMWNFSAFCHVIGSYKHMLQHRFLSLSLPPVRFDLLKNFNRVKAHNYHLATLVMIHPSKILVFFNDAIQFHLLGTECLALSAMMFSFNWNPCYTIIISAKLCI